MDINTLISPPNCVSPICLKRVNEVLTIVLVTCYDRYV